MIAVFVTSFNQTPRYVSFSDPMLTELIEVLENLTHGGASGMHYSITDGFPLVAGVDGIGCDKQRHEKLPLPGITAVVILKDVCQEVDAVACAVDTVLDFLRSDSSVRVMETMMKLFMDPICLLTWLYVNPMACEVAAIPSVFLRSPSQLVTQQ